MSGEQVERVYRIFLSSTYRDRPERRALVFESILLSGMQPIGMEYFVGDTKLDSKDKCLELARQADLVLGIVAWRYGWIPPGETRSITELECEAARERLMFVVDEDQSRRRAEEDEGGRRHELQQKLDEFKSAIFSGPMPIVFRDDNLGSKVVAALYEWRHRKEGRKRHGTIEPVPDLARPDAELAAEIATYTARAEEAHKSLRLAGFRTSVRVPIQLEDLYVPLDATADLRTAGRADFADGREAEELLRGEARQLELPLLEAFDRAWDHGKRRGLALLGDPGSGKTTHLKRLLLWCVRQGPQTLGLPAGTVPVFLPLRELADPGAGLEPFVAAQVGVLRMPPDFAGRLLAYGRLLFLLDGLDEVPVVEREKVARWIEGARTRYPESRFVVTCRYAGYGKGVRLDEHFLELHLRPLTTDQAKRFVHAWFRIVETTLAPGDPVASSSAHDRAEELLARLAEPDFRSARVFELTRNPLLLTAICLVHRDRGRLPNRRAELYEECIDVLLELWREAKKLPTTVSANRARQVLQPMALRLHDQEGRTRATAAELAPALAPALAAIGWKGDGASFLSTIRDESGLLVGWSGEQYGFLHLGFQEYLAARRIRELHFAGEPVLARLADRFGESWWREVTLLLLALEEPSVVDPFFRLAVERSAFARETELVGQCLEDAARLTPAPFVELLEREPGWDPELWERQLAAARALLRSAPEQLTMLAGRLRTHSSEGLRQLIRALEPRASARVRHGIAVVELPQGEFVMGSPKGVGDDLKRPQHKVQLSAFQLGAYQVTNEEYARFLEADSGVSAPRYWGDRRFNQARQPVVGVSWEEARAFCEWTGGSLPTEAQWEYACRAGTTTRWWCGDEEDELERAAWFDRNSGGVTHPVGEKAANPWGLFDVHGNVWEWCEDGFGSYPMKARPDSTGPASGSDRVMRGGSYWSDADGCRSACRGRDGPTNRGSDLGFRVAFPAASELEG